jgi:pilus assembly protein Flp/PilA
MSKVQFKKVNGGFFKFIKLAPMNLIKNSKGQSLVEYMVLVALITAGTIGVVRVVGYNIGIQYENINRSLGAKASNQLQAVSAEQSHLNKKDLSNFLQGSR